MKISKLLSIKKIRKIYIYFKKYIQLLYEYFEYCQYCVANKNKNSVLLIEGNDCHGETLPGLVCYLKKLGYKTDIIITQSIYDLNPFSRMYNFDSRIFIFDIKRYKNFFCLKIHNYKFIIFNSKILYIDGSMVSYDKFFKCINQIKNKILAIEHRQEFLFKNLKNTMILNDFTLNKENYYNTVFPCYFGNIKINKKMILYVLLQ